MVTHGDTVVGRGRARPAVARRRGDEDAGRVRVEERELDRVGVRVAAAGDREVDDVDAVEDRLLPRRRRSRRRSSPRARRPCRPRPRRPARRRVIGPRSMPKTLAEVTTLPADVLAVCVPWPSLSRARSCTSSPRGPGVVGRPGTAARRSACCCRRTRRSAGVSGLSPKSQARGVPSAFAGGADRLPWSANDGCSGHTPVSSEPKMTPLPAFGAGRRAGWFSESAPMKLRARVGQRLAHARRAARRRPRRCRSSVAMLLAGTTAATPP